MQNKIPFPTNTIQSPKRLKTSPAVKQTLSRPGIQQQNCRGLHLQNRSSFRESEELENSLENYQVFKILSGLPTKSLITVDGFRSKKYLGSNKDQTKIFLQLGIESWFWCNLEIVQKAFTGIIANPSKLLQIYLVQNQK